MDQVLGNFNERVSSIYSRRYPCVFQTCGNYYYPGTPLSFFRFPKGQNRVVWKKFCSLSNEADVTSSRLCEKHFKSCFILKSKSCKRLTQTAVPTITSNPINVLSVVTLPNISNSTASSIPNMQCTAADLNSFTLPHETNPNSDDLKSTETNKTREILSSTTGDKAIYDFDPSFSNSNSFSMQPTPDQFNDHLKSAESSIDRTLFSTIAADKSVFNP